MAKANRFHWIAATVITFIGCGSSDLTRARVAEILRQQPKQTPTFRLSHEACQRGAAKGYWRWEYERGGLGSAMFNYHTFQLTAAGMKVFEGDGQARGGVMPGHLHVTLRRPVPQKVLAVSGITDVPLLGPNSKGAEFTWIWDFSDVPSDLSTTLENPTKSGTALFQRYDDGWRLVQLNAK